MRGFNKSAHFSHILRSGVADTSFGLVRTVGLTAYYWPHSGGFAPNAYFFNFDARDVNAAHSPYARFLGFSLRCLQE